MAAGTPQSKEAAVFAKYLEDKVILVADPSPSSRSAMGRLIVELGAKTHNVVLVNMFEHAMEAVEKKNPRVIIAEYDIGKRCGLELFQRLRTLKPKESKDCLFVILTGNTSQTAVARAAEEDLDAYIIKPYTPETVRRTMLQAAIRKIKPPEYVLALEAGKKLMEESKLDEAEAEFTRATALDPSPSLAYYYLGQIKWLRQIIAESKGNYQKGLGFNRIHYKCLVGLYELMMKQNAHGEAYEVVRKLSQYFPANPKRLTEILRLAIVTGKYEDIEKYYSVFTNIDERDETLIKYVCAALVVCGKYYLAGNLGHSRALDLFRKASVTGTGRANILKEIILALVDNGLSKEAHHFLERFPQDARDSEDFLLMKLLIADGENQGGVVINQGRMLMTRGCSEERLYNAMIRRGMESKLSKLAMDEIMEKAVQKLPAKKEHFEKLVKDTEARLKA